MNTTDSKHYQYQESVAATRADCCKLISACFYPPDKKLFSEERIEETLRERLAKVCPEAAPMVPPIGDYLEGERHVALSVAYTRLFLGPPAVLAPPYASFYLDKKSGVMGPSSVEITRLYNKAGLRLDDEFMEMPDHVVVVLEFLYFLLSKEAMAQGDRAFEEKAELEKLRADFLRNYVRTWVPRFCERITAAGEHPVYSALGNCLETFVRYGFKEEEANDHEVI